jgi:hypothetical protein
MTNTITSVVFSQEYIKASSWNTFGILTIKIKTGFVRVPSIAMGKVWDNI